MGSHKDVAGCFEQILDAAPDKVAAVQTPISQTNQVRQPKKKQGTARELGTYQSMDTPVWADYQKIAFISSEGHWIPFGGFAKCPIDADGERKRMKVKRSLLSPYFDDDFTGSDIFW